MATVGVKGLKIIVVNVIKGTM